MATVLPTLANLIILNDQNAVDIGCSDLLDDAPVIAALAAVPASNGTQHKYPKLTVSPTVAFRAANAGKDFSTWTDVLVTETLTILDGSWAVDKAIADSYSSGPEAYIAEGNRRALRAMFAAAEQQFLSDSFDATNGFTGLAAAGGLDALADAMVSTAGGSTADTASSVYLIRTGINDTAFVAGNGGQIEIGMTSVVPVWPAADATLNLPCYYTPITCYMGMQYGSAYNVHRIVNCTEDADDGLTDAYLQTAFATFPAARGPNLIAASRRSIRQLQQSRTATNATGAPAPWPTEFEGMPIIPTDGISNTEALVT